MDGPIIAIVASGITVVGGAIIGGFWRMTTKMGDQSESIGRVEGKVDGLGTTMENFQGQLNGINDRIGRIDDRINGVIGVDGDKRK